MVRLITWQNANGLQLSGAIHAPRHWKHAALFLHGFPGTMDGTAKRFCTALAKADVLCMRFDFAGNGLSAGRFQDKRISSEVRDVRSAMDYLQNTYGVTHVTLIGHSTGATVAALYAHTDARVCKLALLGAVSDLAHAVHYDFTDVQVRSFWEHGYIRYNRPGHWTHRKRLDKAYYDEFFTLNIRKAVENLRVPLLVLHAARDEMIPLTEAKTLCAYAPKPKRLVVIAGADHRFKRAQSHATHALTAFIAAH